MIVTNQKERGRFLRFAFVGVIGAIFDFGIFNLLVATTNIPAIWASAISFTAAVVSNFLWNRYWTYPDSRSKKISTQLFQFIIVSLIGLGIRIIMFWVMENPMIHFFESMVPVNFFLKPTFLGHNATLAIAVLVVMLWNFLANRYWTYGDVS
jgi:putative flippase GtrA